MGNLFVNHPHAAGESYFQHFRYAFIAGSKMIGAGLACITHGCCPFFFEHTASGIIIPLGKALSNRNHVLSKKQRKPKR